MTRFVPRLVGRDDEDPSGAPVVPLAVVGGDGVVNSEAMVSAMAELAGIASGDVTAEELLVRLVDIAAEHLAADGVAAMVNDSGVMRFVHANEVAVEAPERLQELVAEGPCQDAMVFGIAVVVDDLTDPVQTAWPEFVDRALAAGYRSVVVVPLVARGRVWGSLDLYRRTAGTWRRNELEWLSLLAHVAVSYLVVADDRDEARRSRELLEHRSTHDALTGLPNRVLLFDRLGKALAGGTGSQVVAVCFIDLDRFKAINDTFGHAAGDTVLATVATRMSASLRHEDTLARLAGDEFVLVCQDLPSGDRTELDEHVAVVVARLRRALAQPIRVADVDLVVSASIGVAFSDGDLSADDLLADADAAMYRVKQLSGGEPGVDLAAAAHELPSHRSSRHLERQLAEALPRGQLRVHYQPILEPGGAVHAVEALLRWEHPERGTLVAAEFIDLAASSGLVVGMGQWIVAETCAQMGRWRRALGARAPATAFVNLSARELTDPALPGIVARALARHGLRPSHLGLELLESSFMDPDVLPSLHGHQRRGHPLSVDDFGTGYSSLSRLVELPVQMAKVDRAFIAGIADDPRRRALVEAVVTVAAGLDLRVVAEGVETAAQARAAVEAGCDYLQGFHTGRPQPAEVLTARWRA